MFKKRLGVLATVTATTATVVVVLAGSASAHNNHPCHNESGDVTVSHIVGVDGPDPDAPPIGEEGNGIYAVCVGTQLTGARVDNDGSGYCASVVINGTWVGDCSTVVDA